MEIHFPMISTYINSMISHPPKYANVDLGGYPLLQGETEISFELVSPN